MPLNEIGRAAAAIDRGDLVVYPTETVYGLGADALDADAVTRVFEAKGRDREKPVSMAVPHVEAAAEHTHLTDRERAFVREFLPGPVTVVVERGPDLPDVLTAGRDRVGLRIPAHEVALDLLREAAPITATSANVGGTGSVRQVEELDAEIRGAAAVVIDDGETPGGGSTVVDVERGEIHRRGALTEEIESWLAGKD
jgi:L-threonylcarbamoyladenylate synthase